jgi:hypothetical protein
VVVAALSAWHDRHDLASSHVSGITALPAQAIVESYSVLTRLPGGVAVPASLAADVLTRRFPDPPLTLPRREQRGLLAMLADAGVSGGASYDGIVAMQAAADGHTLLTLDRRAGETYRRLGIDHRLIAED